MLSNKEPEHDTRFSQRVSWSKPFGRNGMNVEVRDPAARQASAWIGNAARAGREASSALARMDAAARNAALAAMDAGGGTSAFRDRLMLNGARVEAMARGLDEIAALPDPLARTLADWTRPNGLRIRRVPQPIGV